MGRVLQPGDVIRARQLPTVTGAPVRIPDREGLVHLQFRRYAGCPICTLHLREFAARIDELAAAKVREVVVFHSDRAQLLAYGSGLPFDLVPDPGRELYREFGVERSWRSLANPVTWLAAARGWSRRTRLRAGAGSHFGLPADFLIGLDARVVAVNYGRHASDHWNLDDVIVQAQRSAAT